MADIKNALRILYKLEFNSPSNFLHKNKGEHDYTVAGIYKHAHPNWVGWQIVEMELNRTYSDIKLASKRLYENSIFRNMVEQFYLAHFWLRMKLDKIDSQKTANEIFIFGVNAGTRNATRKAQAIVGAHIDGLIGPMTIKALNDYNADLFDMEFDEIEKQFYDNLIENRPSFAMFQKGWHNRADFV